MKKSMAICYGGLAGCLAATILTFVPVDSIPTPIYIIIHESAGVLGLLVFGSHEAALALELPVLWFYCALFGVAVGSATFVLERKPRC